MKNLEDTFASLDPYAECFLNNAHATTFLIEHGFLPTVIPCHRCSTPSKPSVMAISEIRSSGPTKRIYRCRNKKCREKVSLRKGFRFGTMGVDYHIVLRGIYCWVFNYHTYQALNLTNLSKNTYLNLKDLILDKIVSQPEAVYKIGGPNIKVQFDETAICNGLIITNPSSTYDNVPGIQWIIGGVVEGNCREFVFELLPNRRADTIEDFFRRRVEPGTICVTDGYPSYPSAVRNFGSSHLVVNHSEGFVTADGTHTNNIENMWSHFKTEYRSRCGLNHDRIPLFLKEFSWKKRNIINCKPETLRRAFIKILKFFK